MDKNDSQNKSNEDNNLSKSSNESSFVGKMKFGVSKILPNSLSKWLSPKADGNNARRRRHEEIDSPLIGHLLPHRRIFNSQSIAPPQKKQKIFTELPNQSSVDTLSPVISETSNIVSSTLIENVPHRSNDKFRRYSPLENGQHSETIIEDNASNSDEMSSMQNREKVQNPFALNNDSSVVNFSAHLQRGKSLFRNRAYLSPRLKNYRMRNPRSSLYRSTSSLCDNNSVSSNASSAMSSPFYIGQTTFGGASSISKRFNQQTLQTDIQMLNRSKVPTNLVASRSTSLNNINSTSMSTTTKRILDVLNKYNTPLNEVRRASNALPTVNESTTFNKQLNIVDLDTSKNDVDKTKRYLIKSNTPYTRPIARNANDTYKQMFTTELHVPSMPELLQLKKFATNTMKIRDIANQTDNILNKPAPIDKNNTKYSMQHNDLTSDLDVSNNNKLHKNKNTTNNDTHRPHKNKIRNNLRRQRLSKCDNEQNVMPEPIDLPNVSLIIEPPTKMSFNSVSTKQSQNNDKQLTSLQNVPQIPFKCKPSNSSMQIETKKTNGNDNNIQTIDAMPTKLKNSTDKIQSITSSITFSAPQKNQFYQFSDPIIVATLNAIDLKSYEIVAHTNYTFSEPTFITTFANCTSKTIPNVQSDAKSIGTIPNDSGIAEISHSFSSDTNSKLPTQLTTTMVVQSNKDNTITPAKTISALSTQLNCDDSFKTIAVKQMQGKWSCTECLANNDETAIKCACCGHQNNNQSSRNDNSSKPIIDHMFNSIVEKQKTGKWECTVCMTQNDQANNKCACCSEVNPSKSNLPISENTLTKSTFSFGSIATTAANTMPLDSVFKSIVDKQKTTWDCSACLSANSMSNTKCACCDQSRVTPTSNNLPAISSSAFGGNTIPAKSTFSFGNISVSSAATTQSTFLFGAKTTAIETKTLPTFSFGQPSNKAEKIECSLPSNTIATTNVQSNDVKLSNVTSTTFSFDSKNTLATSKIETPIASDDIFKSIVAKQGNSTWECSSCLTRNANNIDKCACCSTSKDGSTSNTEKPIATANQTFSFGSLGSKPFSFGTKTDNNSLQLTNNAVTTATTAPTSNSFGEIGQKPAFSFSSSTFNAASSSFTFGTPTSTETTKNYDVIDGKQSNNVTILDNVLIKTATNGPKDASAPFSFGQPISTSDIKEKTLKRTSADDRNPTPAKCSSNPSFLFGQSQNTLGASTTQEPMKSTFSFADNPIQTSSAFTTPSVFPSFSFGANATNTTTQSIATPSNTSSIAFNAQTATSPTIFGSNAFASAVTPVPTLDGFKVNTTFTNSTPSFGAPTQNTNISKNPTPGIFQFGANATTAPQTNEPLKTGGFNFNLSTPPTFSFTDQSAQQSNVPFQFGSESTSNLFSATSSESSPVQQRRKLRPVSRLLNRR